MSRTHAWNFVLCWLGLALLLRMAQPGRADLLPIMLDSNKPVITGVNGTLTYNAMTGNFHSETAAVAYTSPAFPFGSFSSGMTTIDLNVDAAGNFVSSGTGLTTAGSLDLDGDSIDDVSGTLLFGRVLNFGADAAGPPTVAFNGTFAVEGGALTQPILLSGGGMAAAEFVIGRDVGGFFIFAENVSSGTLGDFSADFSSDNTKDLIGAIVPEPASWLLGLVGVGTLLGRRWCRKQFS